MKPYLLRAPKETLLALICKLIQTLGRLATALLSMWMLRAAMDATCGQSVSFCWPTAARGPSLHCSDGGAPAFVLVPSPV